jgi:hypothetical protein
MAPRPWTPNHGPQTAPYLECRAQLHQAGHVDLVEGGEHGTGVLGVLGALQVLLMLATLAAADGKTLFVPTYRLLSTPNPAPP